jgi:hypothetical protein
MRYDDFKRLILPSDVARYSHGAICTQTVWRSEIKYCNVVWMPYGWRAVVTEEDGSLPIPIIMLTLITESRQREEIKEAQNVNMGTRFCCPFADRPQLMAVFMGWVRNVVDVDANTISVTVLLGFPGKKGAR